MNTWQKKWGWLFDVKPKIKIETKEANELYFPSKDVLFTDQDKARRGRELFFIGRPTFKNSGLFLKVIFEDIEGPKTILFSKWKLYDTVIKGDDNVSIPIHRILRLKLKKNNLDHDRTKQQFR